MENKYDDEGYFASFPDPLLSRKLLRFSDYPNDKTINEQTINIDISEVIYNYKMQTVYYNGVADHEIKQPVYYQGKRRSGTELTEFRTSKLFPTFLNELEQCIAYLNHWIVEQGLTIELSDRSALANGELTSIPAEEEFNAFLTRLKSEDFSEFETDLFGDGKRYLEKLALLVRNNNIDLSFRKNQIISLLSDEGLRRCVGGCLAILDIAVSNLENYGDYRPEQLVKSFFLSLLQKSAVYSTQLNEANVISQISKIVSVDRDIGEIHIYNYLLQQAKRVFNLRFLVLVDDPHVSFVTGPYHADPAIREKINSILENDFITPIKQRLRTADLVYFISNQLREKLEASSNNPLEKLNKLKGWLSELGNDPHFNQEDFFNDDYLFKLDASLERTIIDRLFNTGWLELDLSRESRLLNTKHFFFKRNSARISFSSQLPFSFETFTSSYRIYFNNLELSWIEIDGKKHRILDFIQQKDGLKHLKHFFKKSSRILVNILIQTSHDMNLFFQALATEDLSFGLRWVNAHLSKQFVTPVDQSVEWMSQFTDDANRYAKILKSVDLSTQKRLLLHLIEHSQPFSVKLQTILNEMAEIPKAHQTELYKIMMGRYDTFYEIINNLFRLDIKDFSRIEFPAFHCKKCFFSLNSRILTYLIEIDFSGCNLDKTIFNAYIRNCQFNEASLDGTTFKKSVVSSSFEQTDLTTAKFQGDNFSDLKLDGAKFSTATFLALVKGTRVPEAHFSGADLRQVDFQTRHIQRELANRVINFNDALLQNTDLSGLFNENNIVLMESANLDGAKLTKCNLARIHPTSYTSMRNVITDRTVLRLDQLFKLYQQGNRDFSTDFIIDWDPKTNLFTRETLAGAHLSYQIVLTLMTNGFTNFDQAQLDNFSKQQLKNPPNVPKLLTSKTLKDRTQRARLERLELGQRKYQELQQIISETLTYRQTTKLQVLNQADLLHSYLFKQKNLEIRGQCVQLTAAFSEAIIRDKHAVFKNNLFVVSQWDKRLIQHKPLSVREVSERNNFLNRLKQFEQSKEGPVHLPSWNYNKVIHPVDIEALIAGIDFAKQQFAWHINLIEPNKKTGHVLGIYNIDEKYTYFDSNVGYIDNINDREIFIRFLKQIIKKSYLIHKNIKIEVDEYLPSTEFIQKSTPTDLEKALFSMLLTERQRLSIQDEALGYLVMNGQLVERTQLYDIGFSYHQDGNLDLPGQLIDAEMKLEQNFLDESLLSKKFSINSQDFKEKLLNYIQEEKKSIISSAQEGNKLDYALRILRELSRVPNDPRLKSPISTESLTSLFEMSASPLERRVHLRSIEKLLKKDIASSEQFTIKLEQNQFQKGLMEGLQGIRKKIPGPKALGGLIVTKSLFDIGISLSQNNRQAALLQSLMLSYGLFAEPWVEQSIIKLPKKFAHFVNQYTAFKITDKVLNAKKIVIPTRLFAGMAANVLDVVSLAHSINLLMEAEYGSKDWRDAIADMTIDSASLLTGAAVVAFQASFGVGIGIGVVLIIVKSAYDGGSSLAEYSAYNLTFAESAQTFFRGTIRLAASEQIQYLRNRQDQIDNQANLYWKKLQAMNDKLSIPIAVYGGGLGEYTQNNPRSYQERTLDPINDKIRKINQALGIQGKIPLLTQHKEDPSPGISDILPLNVNPFKKNLSRLIPKKPDEKNSQYLCLPAFRNETIETFKKTIPEVNFQCVNAVVILNKTQLSDLNATKYKKAILDMEYVYDGLIQKIPDYDNTFLIFNGTTNFFANPTFGSPTMDTFFIKSAHFSGDISLDSGTNSLLILEDNSDIRTHNITLLANNNILMDVFSEKFNGDIEGKFKTKNFGLVVGRHQKQDKYNCEFPVNNTMIFPMQLQGLGGSLKNPDIYTDCPHVILHASSRYHLTTSSNNHKGYGWGFATISINADQAGIIIITPPTVNISDSELNVQAIHFENLNLLQDSRLKYCHVNNKLVITKQFVSPLDAYNLETLQIELIHYWNAIKKRSNYMLYDRYNNLITPLLSNEIINVLQHSIISNRLECFYPQEFSLYRVLNITHKIVLQDLFSLVEIEQALEGMLFNSAIIGPFKLNPHLKVLNFIQMYPYNYTLTINSSGKNIINLINSENKISSFYGSKDEDHYFINLQDIRGQKIIKINNYDPDIGIDRLEIYTHHSSYELCIDQTTHVKNSNSFLFYILDRYEEAQTYPSLCTGGFDSSWPHVAAILLQNYLLSDAYQHLEICVSIEEKGMKCFIPFLDKDASPKPVWFFKRYFRNAHEQIFFQLDPSFSDIVVEGDVTRFQAIQREQDLILLKGKEEGSTGYNSFSLWFPAYYFYPARWDLFHIYTTQNATTVDSRMHVINNNYIRELSKITVDYSLLENRLRFYELSLTENNTLIDHNQLQSDPFYRNRRDISSLLPKIEFDIGYLKISKNESFNLVDIKVERDKNNLLFYIYMKDISTREITSFLVTAKNWDKPEYRLAGLVHRQLTILDLNQWDLEPISIGKMQLHIHEKLLEHQINSVLENDLKTLIIWNKLRIFLLLLLPVKGYDIQTILHFMQKTLDFESIEEFLTFLPEQHEDSQALIQDLKSEIAQNETITEKIKSLLLYHVAKASFPGQENTRQIVMDSFSMVPERLISSIYSQMRIKILSGFLLSAQAYMETACSSSTDDVRLSEWLDILNETSSKNPDYFTRKKLTMPTTDSDLHTSIDLAEAGRDKNLRMRLVDKTRTAEAVRSSATRSESGLNSLCKMFLEFFRENLKKFLLRNQIISQSVFPLAQAKGSTVNHPVVLDRCIPGVRYGDTYREEGITYSTKNRNAKIATTEDKFFKQHFRPIECNGHPAVYFEGEKTHVLYIPELFENPLDQFNEQLVLFQALFHEGKKFYGWCKNFFREKPNRSQGLVEESVKISITHEMKISWKESLDNIEKQLCDVIRLARGKVDLSWILYILEDRKDEFNYLNQLSESNTEKVNRFTEDLKALQKELLEIRIDLDLTDIKQRRGFLHPTNNANRLMCKHYESSGLFSFNKSNKGTQWFFFKAQSCKETIKKLGFDANNRGVDLRCNVC